MDRQVDGRRLTGVTCFISKVDLSELATADTLVLSVTATDEDSGLNGEVTYRLLSSPLQGFHIQADSGKMV